MLDDTEKKGVMFQQSYSPNRASSAFAPKYSVEGTVSIAIATQYLLFLPCQAGHDKKRPKLIIG